MTPNLYAITFDYTDGVTFFGHYNIFSVEVDMDKDTAEKRVLDHIKDSIDEDEWLYYKDDIDIGEIIWKQVPDVVDGHEINIVEVV